MFYPGQRVMARDGALYVLAFQMEGVWLGFPVGAELPALPVVVEPRYPAWGGDDERSGADMAGATGGVIAGRVAGARKAHRRHRR